MPMCTFRHNEEYFDGNSIKLKNVQILVRFIDSIVHNAPFGIRFAAKQILLELKANPKNVSM